MTYKNASRPEAQSKTPLTDADWAEVERLYGEGELDITIAARVGCSSKTIARWRWANGLERRDRPTSPDS